MNFVLYLNWSLQIFAVKCHLVVAVLLVDEYRMCIRSTYRTSFGSFKKKESKYVTSFEILFSSFNFRIVVHTTTSLCTVPASSAFSYQRIINPTILLTRTTVTTHLIIIHFNNILQSLFSSKWPWSSPPKLEMHSMSVN